MHALNFSDVIHDAMHQVHLWALLT
jgi:hypothetical protein